MAEITKIKMNGALIEEKDGQIYINGKHIETGKPTGLYFTLAILFSFMLGASALGFVLLFVEHLIKLMPV